MFFCSIFDRQKNEKNHFLTSVVPLPRLTYRPSLRFPNTLPQTRMLPLFFGFKGNDLLLIFKLQSPAGGGQLPEPSPFSALPPSVPAANNPLYRPATPLLRHTLYKLQQRFFLRLICHSTPVRARFIAPNRGKFPLAKPTRESYRLEEEQLCPIDEELKDLEALKRDTAKTLTLANGENGHAEDGFLSFFKSVSIDAVLPTDGSK